MARLLICSQSFSLINESSSFLYKWGNNWDWSSFRSPLSDNSDNNNNYSHSWTMKMYMSLRYPFRTSCTAVKIQESRNPLSASLFLALAYTRTRYGKSFTHLFSRFAAQCSQVKVIRTVSRDKLTITLLWPYQSVCILLFIHSCCLWHNSLSWWSCLLKR